MKIIYLLFLAVFSTVQALAPNIFQVDSIAEISQNQPAETIYFFDIDDTLFDYPHMLGSKAWRSYIVKATENYKSPGSHHDIFSLFLAENHAVQTVEAATAGWVKELQIKGHAVYGLTARERNIWYYTPREQVDVLTTKQLVSVGIDFDQNLQTELHIHFSKTPEYFKGIFFSDLDLKGDYVKKLLGNIFPRPKKVVFIDDKYEQVKSVALALAELGIDHECYWYRATDKKVGKFNPLIANIQLYHAWKSGEMLSDVEAELIAKQYPEKDANDYLQDLLKGS